MSQELIGLTQRLLDSIAAGDWEVYESICTEDMTCFEPEAMGHCVHGLPFHRFYFDLAASSKAAAVPPPQTTLADPHVRLLGDSAAVVTYTRLIQRPLPSHELGHVTIRANETRVFERRNGLWRNVHFHRSN